MVDMNTEDVRVCRRCRKEQPAANFYKGKRWCKKCCSEDHKTYVRKLSVKNSLVCRTCKKEQPAANFHKGQTRCKKCVSEYQKIRTQKILEKGSFICCTCKKEQPAANFSKMEVRCKKCCSEYSKIYVEKNRERMKKERMYNTLFLSHSYIKGRINSTTDLIHSEITPELIDMKTELIELHREIKEATNGINRA